jgi:hypothetical protein
MRFIIHVLIVYSVITIPPPHPFICSYLPSSPTYLSTWRRSSDQQWTRPSQLMGATDRWWSDDEENDDDDDGEVDEAMMMMRRWWGWWRGLSDDDDDEAMMIHSLTLRLLAIAKTSSLHNSSWSSWSSIPFWCQALRCVLVPHSQEALQRTLRRYARPWWCNSCIGWWWGRGWWCDDDGYDETDDV